MQLGEQAGTGAQSREQAANVRGLAHHGRTTDCKPGSHTCAALALFILGQPDMARQSATICERNAK